MTGAADIRRPEARAGGGRADGSARAALGAALALVCILAGTWGGASHLAATWASSPTYHHGALVPLVSAYLVWLHWRRGERLTGWALPLWGVGAGALAYAVGTALDARLAQHAGIAVMLACGAAALMGRAAATRHRFALAFLLFMVPSGEGLVPALQEVTARGIMGATALFGVPALRDGMMIATPAGDFEVAEACAGLRFVIASLVTGVLCAHLFFTSARKQAVMIAAAALVPVLANVVRASGTVLIAEATDMRRAAGADHLIYGWAFFAVVTGAVVLVALRRAEPDAPALPAPAFAPGPDPLVVGAAIGAIGLACALPGLI